jgi:uncharacterized protein (DUF1684 family)
MSYLLDGEQMTTPELGRNQKQRNGMWKKNHRPDSVKKISESQKSRFEFYRKAADNIMTEDRVREIIQETINDYLSKNALENKNNTTNNIPL